MRVIVVEDEIRIREGICKLIETQCKYWEVIGQAENGSEGLALILNYDPDLIITDMRMPIMDGLKMLTLAYEKKAKAKVIVISAYSEFTYAQQAIKLGVSEYLLKPIIVNDFIKAMKNIEIQLEHERSHNPKSIRSLEQIYVGLILGGLKLEKDLEQFLYINYGIESMTEFSTIVIGLDSMELSVFESTKKFFHEVMHEKYEKSYSLLEFPKENVIIIIIQNSGNSSELERWFQNRILQSNKAKNSFSAGIIHTIGISKIKSDYQTLLKYFDWNIVLGDNVLISYPKILKVQTVPCMYPLDIEKRLKVALCKSQKKEIEPIINTFNSYFIDGKVYNPKEVKECYIRFIWAIINILKEIGYSNIDALNQQSILEKVINANNRIRLAQTVIELSEEIQLHNNSKGEEYNQTSLVIKRAQQLINEFYYTGITLDEIATKLSITPEYLGTLFFKEMGTHFSDHIKNLRINKAKELLIGTSLKQYAIAAKVGYTDPKYFSRVFRECTGLSPAEYRNMNK